VTNFADPVLATNTIAALCGAAVIVVQAAEHGEGSNPTFDRWWSWYWLLLRQGLMRSRPVETEVLDDEVPRV
jgi:hypothetical protein